MRGITLLAAMVGMALATTVVAQRPGPAVADPFAAPPGPRKADAAAAKADPAAERLSAAAKIEQELDKTTELDMVEMPLKDVMVYLTERHNIPIVLITRKLEEASVSADSPVTKSLRGIRLRSALNLMLGDLDLAYVIRDEVLQITTPEDAQTVTEVRIYDCRDLLTMAAPVIEKSAAASEDSSGGARTARSGGFGGMPEPRVSEHDRRAGRLMAIITTNVDPQTWQTNDGTGNVSEYNGLIVVTQTAPTHRKIEQVLGMLRRAAGLETPKTARVIR